jgi:dephospho-CoA kinase
MLNQIWVVDCGEETQISRVQLRSQLTRDQVTRIMAAQSSRLERRKTADIVLYNQDLTLDALQTLVQHVSSTVFPSMNC